MSDGHHCHHVLLVVDHVQRPVLTPPRAPQLLQRRVELLAQPVRVPGHRPGQVLEQGDGRTGRKAVRPRRAAAVNTTTPAPLKPAKAINARTWQLIAKDPDAHAGERVVVYGQVTQFDATTGTDNFRANVDGVVHKPEYGYADYETNTLLSGDEAALKDVVQGDLFKAEVTVAGAKSYDTAIGGNTTAPQLTVTKIDVVGHLD
jgi:hypothetical protein